jgi:hypothetical protein
METLVRDLDGYVHRRFEDVSMNSDEITLGEEEIDETELVDISSDVWCKHCFEMDTIEDY